MAFDGTTVACIVYELQSTIQNGKINKIAQPEKDELLLTIKSPAGQFRLSLSANASLPLAYLTTDNKPSPMTAPNFCMLLRKHISGGRITKISQPGLERIINFQIEHLNELGDPAVKTLVLELMGKHSNLIFLDENLQIIDSIKHISAQTSSVREVLPGRQYFIPNTLEKEDPFNTDYAVFCQKITSCRQSVSKGIFSSYTGISPLIANELCYRASIDPDRHPETLSDTEFTHLFHIFELFMEDICDHRFSPCMIYEDSNPVEYACFPLSQYQDAVCVSYNSISALLEEFFSARDLHTRIRQKSADLRKVVTTLLERSVKKYDLQKKQLADTEKKDRYQLYGELLLAYGHSIKEGQTTCEVTNYYDQSQITIPLNPEKNGTDNAQAYFQRYQKLKRTYEALSQLIQETLAELKHLESISSSLELATSEDDLLQIRQELVDCGYLHRKGPQKKVKIHSVPLHFVTKDGFDLYVGKNNLQNDELTFHFANGGDWWFHTKGIPGSHVVLRSMGREIPDHTFEEAAALAAYYSSGRDNDKVEVDYLQRRDVKKPNGAKPGFVVYYTNFSMAISPSIKDLTLISK